mgnify:CR=1 FL=1
MSVDTEPGPAVRPEPRAPRWSPGPVLHAGTTVSLRVRPRVLTVGALLVVVVACLSATTLALGDMGVAPHRLATVLAGGGEATESFVLERLRGPRLAVAVGTGAALGIAGALFQSVTRNPLGSPDVIGLGAGAGAGAALVALALPGVVPVPFGALAGAGLAIALVTVVTGTGLRHPGRLIVAGIGVAAMAQAFTHFVVSVMARDRAAVLASYLNGSLGARSWEHVVIIWVVLLLTAPLLTALAGRIRTGEMGDAIAAGLGASPGPTRVMAIVLSVVLTAAAVSVAGPIAFVSLTAPQIARRLSGVSGPNIALSALVGAVLLVAADLAVQHSPGGAGLPVGIFTMALGGVHLGYLLLREWRRGVL